MKAKKTTPVHEYVVTNIFGENVTLITQKSERCGDCWFLQKEEGSKWSQCVFNELANGLDLPDCVLREINFKQISK